MDLSKIVLEQVEREEFDQFLCYWHKSLAYFWPNMIYAQVTSTLVYKRYEDAIEDFFDNPEANQLSVNVQGRWAKINSRDLETRDIDTIVKEYSEIARADRYKQNFFEMKFGFGADARDLLVISFVEFDKQIIGQDIRLPADLFHYITIKTKKPADLAEIKEPKVSELIEQIRGIEQKTYVKAHGIWIPD